MATDRFEAGRCDAAAVAAVGISPELTRRDALLQIRRQAIGRLREDAFIGRLGWLLVDVEEPFGQLQLRRSEEHTSELQSLAYLVCRLLLEKKKKKNIILNITRR